MATKKKTPPAKKKVSRAKSYVTPKNSKHKTVDKLTKFIQHLAISGNISAACRRAKIHPTTISARKKTDAVFAAAYDDAMDVAVDVGEGEMFRRAIEGVKKPVFQGGKKVGSITEYSDGLLGMIVKGRRRHIYGDNFKLSGDPNAPLEYSDIGRDGAMAEIAAIFVGAGLKPPVDPCAGNGIADGTVASTSGAADPSKAK